MVKVRRKCRVACCGRTFKDGVKLFHLPNDKDRRELWLSTVKWAKNNTNLKVENLLICSKHFRTGIAT